MMRFRKRFLSILLSSALIVSNLSTTGISVLAEELEGATEVATEALVAASDEELEDVAEENGSEENEPEEEKEEEEEEVTEKVPEKGTEGSTEKVTEETTDNEVADETAESTEEDSEKDSEDVTAESTEEDSEKDSEEVTEKEETHTPENITNQITQLRLNLGNAWYIDPEYGEVSLEEYDGLIDYSAISDISTVGLDVLYRLTQDGSERTVCSGDWYEITLPNVVSNVRLTGGESFGSDIPMDILDIQINGNTIKATFNQNIDDIDLSQIHGKQHIAFEVNKEVLTEETSSYIVNLQPENNCELRLPARVSEEMTASSVIDMEKITVVAASFSALLNDYFGEAISEEQSLEEIYEIIQSAVAEMDEEKLDECINRTMEALDVFDSLSFEEAEYFSENEPYLYNTVMGSLSEVLASVMMGEVTPMSLLPLEEIYAYLVLYDKTEAEVSAMPVNEVLNRLVDSDGNHIQISDDATVVLKYVRSEEDGIEKYEKYNIDTDGIVTDDEIINLSVAEGVNNYILELIVGDGSQLAASNKRYIIKVYLSDDIEDQIQFELYKRNADGTRMKVVPENTQVTNAVNGFGWKEINTRIRLSSHSKGDEYYLGATSTLAEIPYMKVEAYDIMGYLLGADPITDQLLFQDMSQPNAGYISSTLDSFGGAFVFEYTDTRTNEVTTKAVEFQIYNKDEVTCHVHLLDGDTMKESAILVGNNVNFNWDNLFPDDQTFVRTTRNRLYMLNEGLSADDDYYFYVDIYDEAYGNEPDNYNSHVIKAVEGQYSSIDEAAGAPDIKEYLTPTNKSGIYGYKANYNHSKPNGGTTFTIFYDDGGKLTLTVGVIEYNPLYDPNYIKEFTEAPIIGEPDPWFRITGAKDINGEVLDAYVIENGKNMNIDTMYGYGYQTVFISKNVNTFEPTFWMADTEAVSIESIYVDGHKFNVGDTLSFADNENTLDVIFSVVINDASGRHTKNYEVHFVKRVNGPQLYVAGPLDPEIRSVFLDEYFEYKHDIFVANVGDEPLQDLRLELDATNAALDSYWTIGGEGNDTLAACPENFRVEQISTSYGELPNIAKIRLIPDGDNSGDIEGTLKIFSGSSLLATINLSGRAQNPQISTKGLEEAVKYVPYSYMITTNNMYDWNNVKLTIIDGELPPGMTFDSDTGEIYGAPLAAGEYKFTIKADFSRSDYFAPATKELTITVLDNENATVFNTSDSGYAIIPSEDGEIGFVGEQVSAYDFVVTTFDDDDMYISEGEYGQFVKLWLNGEVLVDGVDYTKAPGSTKITIKAQTLENKTVPGRNTISAEYNIDGERGEKLKRTSQNFRVDIKKPDPTPDPSDPTPGQTDPTPDPTPDPTDPTPGPTDPTPDPTDPTPGSTDPAPGQTDPTPGPTDPTPSQTDPTPGQTDPTTEPTDSTPGTNNTTNNPNNSTQTTVETISIMTISAVGANDAPLASTTIEVHSTPKTAVTDENGNVSFTDVEFGTHTIYVKNEDGSIMSSKNFELTKGSNLSINGNQITAPKGSDISIKIKIDNGEISFESVTLNSAPKTGDDTKWILYLMLLLGSIPGIFITFVNMKKRRYRNR